MPQCARYRAQRPASARLPNPNTGRPFSGRYAVDGRRYCVPMAIGSVPVPATLGWALVGAVVVVGAGAVVGLGAYRQSRRILRRGARLSAEIVAAEIAP